jgi:aminoglycoside/choline kinase family phosphotransferase
MHDRPDQLARFLATTLQGMGRAATGPWHSITGDASFRRFHRVHTDGGPLVLVDAPPATENNGQYLRIATRWAEAGLAVPRVFAADLEHGFFVVEDFGDLLFSQALATQDADALYRRAIELLWRIQALPDDGTCPPYEMARFEMELGIFREWFLGAALGHVLTPGEAELLGRTERTLLASIASQPRACVHRDWHSRNLLVLPSGELGIIDFQDALVGPYVYDLVSLLRDCYQRWPDAQVAAWQAHYLQGADARFSARATFATDFDLTGMQRHLKAVGIFARLWKRDGRTGYLADIPRVLGYLRDVGSRHPELADFAGWIDGTIAPAWAASAPA